MQKIIRRVATTERVAAKRAKKIKYYKQQADKDESNSTFLAQRRAIRDDISLAKSAYKDDWKLGPLAPRINHGETGDNHGAVNEARFMTSSAELMSKEQLAERCKWAGRLNRLNIAQGDRVVVLEGPDKGRIGKISDIDLDKAMVTVEGLNKSNVRAPSHMQAPGQPANYTLEFPLPISSVRLVYPVQNPTTGITKDVIINQLVATEYVRDRVTGKERWTRTIPGLSMAIPWPEKPPKEVKEHPADTLRIRVEQRTFIPTLLRPPMPESVLDELRGKYSRFRTRHEPEYIAAKEAEAQAAKERNATLMDSIRTPLQELHRHERAEKKKKGKPRLTLEMLEEIGKVIAKNRERTLNAAAMSSVEPVPATAATEVATPPPSEDAVAEKDSEAPTQPPAPSS
ncbi:uncharacterized protein B0I36DRAFT_10797 [Microdochium trichocladiopsis]|uniref:KOW domain-containing protein n=1 Tax=Microdochium trichocladiopsis TaxID=1682393 RepID=A0A9P9BZU2_9PEZI|nr:uncharacterized protein B0I36DRAFT_10797 [Microdochium trichocladiopsis]KAH7040469.1 hypothetical protein B0I36DRAFT_10797 [Microdochium trichocladiopsis]